MNVYINMWATKIEASSVLSYKLENVEKFIPNLDFDLGNLKMF